MVWYVVKPNQLTIDGTLLSTTTPDQIGLAINVNENTLDISKVPELEPHHQMQFFVISGHSLGGSYSSAGM